MIRPRGLRSSFWHALRHGTGILILAGGTGTSCAHRATPPLLPPSTEEHIGVIRAVGPGARFVLIETTASSVTNRLVTGEVLHGRPSGSLSRVATTDLRVSAERHQTLATADVAAGQPTIGDVVYAVNAAAATPRPTLNPLSISAAALPPLNYPGPNGR